VATDCIAQLIFRYQGLRAPIVARFDVPHASSDGGLVLLKAVDERLRLTETDQARGLDHPVGAPHRAAPAAGLSLARALAAGRAGGRRSSQLTAAPSPRPACPTADMVSLPGPASIAWPARRGRPSGGIGPHLGRVDLREVVRCDRGVHQGRATHVVRAFANRSG
jgi:hypothetical protein